MKNKSKQIIHLMMVMAAASFLLTGCSSDKNTPIVTINDKKLYMKDFLYDIYLTEKDGSELEADYQEQMGSSYWDIEYNGTTLREAAKNSIMATVVMDEILADQAGQKGISLSDNELSVNEEAINAITNSSSWDALNRAGLSLDDLKAAYNKKALGEKYRNEMAKYFNIDEDAVRESLKPEDYHEYKTECLFIPIVKVKDNQITSLSEKQKAVAQSTITQGIKELREGKGMDDVLNKYPSLKYESIDFVIGDKNSEEEYQTAAIALKKGEFSDVVPTKYGYYIIHMLDNDANDRYEQAVDDAVKAKEEEQFEKAYNEIKKQYQIIINFDAWDKVTIGQITVPKN